MGMYDEVICECDLPEGMVDDEGRFQTKALYQVLLCFTITKEGRLICPTANNEVDKPPIDLGFHGDIKLTGCHQGTMSHHVARFTHGTLEWIRPLSALPESLQDILK